MSVQFAMRSYNLRRARISPSGSAARMLFCVTCILFSVSAHAFDFNGAWTTNAQNCGKVFVKKNNSVSVTRNADAYGGGFVVEANQIRGSFLRCKITTRKDEGAMLNLIAACSTDVALSPMQFSAKIEDENKITRIYPGMSDVMTVQYVRCDKNKQ